MNAGRDLVEGFELFIVEIELGDPVWFPFNGLQSACDGYEG